MVIVGGGDCLAVGPAAAGGKGGEGGGVGWALRGMANWCARQRRVQERRALIDWLVAAKAREREEGEEEEEEEGLFKASAVLGGGLRARGARGGGGGWFIQS